MSDSNPIEQIGDIKVFCTYDRLVPIGELIPNPQNPTVHPPDQIAKLVYVLINDGWRYPIVVSRPSGMIVAGHGRLLAAQALEMPTVPVDYQDFDNPETETAAMIASNHLAELAETNTAVLKDLLQELDCQDGVALLTGYDDSDLLRLMSQFHPDEPEPEEELPATPIVIHGTFTDDEIDRIKEWVKAHRPITIYRQESQGVRK